MQRWNSTIHLQPADELAVEFGEASKNSVEYRVEIVDSHKKHETDRFFFKSLSRARYFAERETTYRNTDKHYNIDNDMFSRPAPTWDDEMTDGAPCELYEELNHPEV